VNLLIVDTETTGLNKQLHSVIEVAAIVYSVEHKTILQQISTLLPVKYNEQEHVNKISVASSNSVYLSIVNTIFDMANYVEYIVAHNAEFDKQWFDDEHLPLLNNFNGDIPWICTCHEFEFPNQTRQGQSLVELALLHDVPVVSAHRALTDCQLIASIFDKIDDLEDRIELAAEPRFDCVAHVSYNDRQLAKDNGFRWDGESKTWNRKLSERQIKELPFSVSKVNNHAIVI
jgi:DNA polymerase III subunit epsilon